MAWSGATTCIGGVEDLREAFASEQITFSTAVLKLTVKTYNPSQNTVSGSGSSNDNRPAQGMMVSVITAGASAGINFTLDGTAPTNGVAGVGHQMAPADNVVIMGLNNIINFQAIRTSTVDTLVQFTYFR